MTQYNRLNVKLFNPQLNKLKSVIKNGIEITLNLSSNLIGNSNDATNFRDKLILTNTKVSKNCKTFTNGSSANPNFSKIELSKIALLGGFIPGLSILGPPILPKLISSTDPIINSFVKEYRC